MKKGIVLIALSALLTACGGINYVSIETCNPGEVTFPAEVKRVLMVNNAVPQPDNSGYTYKLEGVLQDTVRAGVDSALFDLCTACGRAILDASYFEDVLLFHDPLQEKGVGELVDQKLTKAQVEELCAANGADAVISLDKMLFKMTKEVAGIGAGFVGGTVKVEMAGILRSYLPQRDQPLATVLVQDSVEFQQAAETLELLNYYLPAPDEALRIAGCYLGDKVAEYFVPHWSEATRYFYSSSNSRWKEASAYGLAGRWEEAGSTWERLYRSTSSKSGRAKLASNLALAEEMQNDFRKAYEWAEKAHALFCETEGSASNNANLMEAYAEVLKARIQSEYKLNIQIKNKQ